MTQTLSDAWNLLRKNWIIVVPSLIVGAISAAIAYVLTVSGALSWAFFTDLDSQGPAAFWAFFETIVALALRIFSLLVTIAFTTGMAGAAWQRGVARFADGAAAFRKEGVQALVALAILFCLGFVAAALALPTFFLSVVGYMVFLLYTMPAVIVGDRPATEAVVDSIGLAWRNFGITLLVVVLIIVLALSGGLIGSAISRVPLAGDIVAWIVMQVVAAYAVMVAVGEYLKLRGVPRRAP